MSNKRCQGCGGYLVLLPSGGEFCQSCASVGGSARYDKRTPPERPEPKPPIYSCEVIHAACHALEALAALVAARIELSPDNNLTSALALRILYDGLASHERAIKGES